MLEDKINTLVDIDCEQMFLSCILNQHIPENADRMYSKVSGFLFSEHFYNDFHAAIYGCLPDIMQDGFTPLKVCRAIGKDPQSEDGQYIVKLASRGGVGFKDYAVRISEIAKKRRLVDFLKNKIERIDIEEVEKLLPDIASEVEDIQKSNAVHDMQTEMQVLDEIFTDFDTPKVSYSSGIDKLDKAMGGGFFAGKCYGFAARKKMGKTMLASTLVDNLSQNGVKTVFCAGEMSPKEIYHRIVARRVGRNSIAFLDKPDQRLIDAVGELRKTTEQNIHWMKTHGITFKELRRRLYSSIRQTNAKCFVIDYIQLILADDNRTNKAQHMGEVAQWMADFCRENEVFGIVLAQINQEGNIRDGEAMRLAFDQVYQIHKSGEPVDGIQQYWMEQMDSRYTPWCNVGEDNAPALIMDKIGPHFREI